MTSATGRGRFISLEGMEGAGKSTNLHLIRRFLEARDVPLLVTREPGGTPLAEEIRELLLAVRSEPVQPLAELLLMFAARRQHVATAIEPALAAGTWVLCDRFTDATYAYQGGGREMDMAFIATLEQATHGGLEPDLTFFLDLDWSEAMSRIQGRPLDRFELEARAFFDRVREVYLQRATANPRFAVIDAAEPLEDVQRQLQIELEQRVAHWLNESSA
ncbi:MAG: dTMP kinase [Pseudomonadota bacterium]